MIGRVSGYIGVFAVGGVVALAPSAVRSQSTMPSYLQEVVSYHAPFFLHETAVNIPNVEAKDQILPVDFDGDLNGQNNYDDAYNPSSVVNGVPVVYTSVVETGATSDRGYYFLGYYLYHPQDGGQSFSTLLGQVVRPGHEHDFEGAYFVVKKSPYLPYGELQVALTQAHGALLPFVAVGAEYTGGGAYSPAGDGWVGIVNTWHDFGFPSYRPVVAVRARTHANYMAQNFANGDSHFGIDPNSPDTQMGAFVAQIHGDDAADAIIYAPIPMWYPPSTGVVPQRLGPTVRGGEWGYGLVEVAASPLWAQHATLGLFTGNFLSFAGGGGGYDIFWQSGTYRGNTTDPNGSANPMWQWLGGTGECAHNFSYECWYSFDVDNTGSSMSRGHWPESPNYGRLLTDPAAEIAMRFPWLPELSEPVVYNPYISVSPPCCGGQELTVGITGPDQVNNDWTSTWTATVSGGTAPYTYSWSGLFYGTSSSVSGSVSSSDDLYLDVTDAVGTHVSVSKYISATGCTGPNLC